MCHKRGMSLFFSLSAVAVLVCSVTTVQAEELNYTIPAGGDFHPPVLLWKKRWIAFSSATCVILA